MNLIKLKLTLLKRAESVSKTRLKAYKCAKLNTQYDIK